MSHLSRDTNLTRVTSATLGLVAGGAFAGASVGTAWLGVLALAVDGPGGFPYMWQAFGIAAAVGAALGAIGLPAVTWGFLRHVPFGRVLTYTAVGTLLGATLGAVASGISPIPAILSAVAGFLCAAVFLRIRNPRTRA